MATSRTGTARWKRTVRIVRHRERHLTHCPIPTCRVPLDWEHGRRPNSAEVDHIIPHARGGTDDPDNARIICRRCNQSMGAKQPRQHRPQRIPAAQLNASDDW